MESEQFFGAKTKEPAFLWPAPVCALQAGGFNQNLYFIVALNQAISWSGATP